MDWCVSLFNCFSLCPESRDQPQVWLLRSCPSCFVKQSLAGTWSSLARLAEQSLSVHRLCQPSAGLQYTLPCSLCFPWVLGSKHRSWCLHGKHCPGIIFSAPPIGFFVGISQANLKNKGTRITKTLLKRREHLLFLEMGKGDVLSTLWLWPRNLLTACHCCRNMKRVNECAHASVSLPLSSRVLSCDCLSWPTDLSLPVLL